MIHTLGVYHLRLTALLKTQTIPPLRIQVRCS